MAKRERARLAMCDVTYVVSDIRGGTKVRPQTDLWLSLEIGSSSRTRDQSSTDNRQAHNTTQQGTYSLARTTEADHSIPSFHIIILLSVFR